MSQDLKINKGVELMLRRDKKVEPKRRGLRVSQTITLLGKTVEFKFELTWGDHH